MILFHHDDAWYTRWMDGTEDGFVVNAHPPGSTQPPMLHRSRCGHLYPFDPPDPDRRRTLRPKACATDRAELEAWARRDHYGRGLAHCPDCKP